MSELPEPDPSAIVTLLQGLPRVKITPETITQHTIDKWYEREREYRAEIERLRTRAQTAEERLDGQAWDDLEAERDRLNAIVKRARALCAELMTVDPADLTRAQRRQLPASATRAVLAALDQPSES